MRRARRRLGTDGESGMTLIELLVATAMGTILMAGVTSMLISAMRSQPEVSGRAQNISQARWMMERMTREIRNGYWVEDSPAPTSSTVSFVTNVRRTSCGGSGVLPSSEPAKLCKVTYNCTATACSRSEVEAGKSGGLAKRLLSGIDDSDVFSYVPAGADPEDITHIEVTLHIPNPSGPADITVTDGASLRNATLTH